MQVLVFSQFLPSGRLKGPRGLGCWAAGLAGLTALVARPAEPVGQCGGGHHCVSLDCGQPRPGGVVALEADWCAVQEQ